MVLPEVLIAYSITEVGMSIRFLVLNIAVLALLACVSGCQSGSMDPGLSPAGDDICYTKWSNGHWQIFTNNALGTMPVNIPSWEGDDEYPKWSPNGRYIVFQRRVPIYGPLVCVYDLTMKTYANLTADGGLSSAHPTWTPTGKVVCAYQCPVGSPVATYLMDPDGSNKRKILDAAASTVYMYPNGYTFLYEVYNRIYKTHMDQTATELVFDEATSRDQFVAVQGLNANSEEILIIFHPRKDSTDAIGTYSIRSRTVRVLLTSESGYEFFQLVYAPDCSAIALIEHSDDREYLSVLQGGVKRRLVHIPGTITTVGECFSFNPMRFSPDGNYIAYSKMVFGSGQWINWKDVLFVVPVSLGEEIRIDDGNQPSWNSRMSSINNRSII